MKNPSLKQIVVKETDSALDNEPPSLSGCDVGKFVAEESIEQLIRRSRENVSTSKRSLEFLKKHFPFASLSDWENWHWQIRNSIKSINQLKDILDLSEDEKRLITTETDSLPVRITPYYASLLDKSDHLQPLRKSVVPVIDEFVVHEGEASDPLHEVPDSPISNLVHRYPDRVLFLVTGFCSAYCRYCTRSHMVAKEEKCHFSNKNLEQAFLYIESHTEIRDVLLSGGDPLTMSDDKLVYILNRLKKIPHIEIIRIGTKVPVVLPQRITGSLVSKLKKFHPLYLSIHFTHPDELTPECQAACKRLADAGIPLGSQTVLLKGINDDITVMKKLMHELLKVRVKPYYIYQCDPILGSQHFRTSVTKGLEIIQGLRGWTSGYAVPQYVIDAPGGGGKIPVLPEYYQGKKDGFVILRNYEGKIFKYRDPE